MEQDRKGHRVYDKGGQNIQWRKDSVFNKWCGENWTATRKRIKYPEINLPQKAKDLYFETCRMLVKEIEDTNIWKDILVLKKYC